MSDGTTRPDLAELRRRAEWMLKASPTDSAPTLDPKVEVFAADLLFLLRAAEERDALRVMVSDLSEAVECARSWIDDDHDDFCARYGEHDAISSIDLVKSNLRKAATWREAPKAGDAGGAAKEPTND